MSRLALLLLGVAGALLGLTAERAAFGWDDPRHWLPDLAVGWFFIVCGLVGRWRRPDGRTGSLMVAVGFTWFLGNFASVDIPAIAWLSTHALYLHRGPLIHCVLSFPSGRLPSRLDRAAVAVGYVAATITPIARNEVATAILGALVMAVAVRGYVAAIGPARRTRRLVVRAAVAVGIAFSGGALARLAFPAGTANEAALLAYETVLCAVAVGLLIGLLRASSERAAVTDLVVELAESPSGTLRDALAGALGDPTLQVGYWLPESGRYVDARGRRLELPQPGTGRAVTPIELDGRPIGILVHDPAVLDDPGLLDSIASAARLAASNARLQAEVRAQVAEVMASRRRLVEVGDQERRRLERRLREGAEQRLDMLAGSLVKAQALAEESAEARRGSALSRPSGSSGGPCGSFMSWPKACILGRWRSPGLPLRWPSWLDRAQCRSRCTCRQESSPGTSRPGPTTSARRRWPTSPSMLAHPPARSPWRPEMGDWWWRWLMTAWAAPTPAREPVFGAWPTGSKPSGDGSLLPRPRGRGHASPPRSLSAVRRADRSLSRSW
jgi:hypothetical protein